MAGGTIYTVPPGVIALNIQLWGADGGAGAGGSLGGLGGYSVCTLAATAGTTFTVIVGQAGSTTTTPTIGYYWNFTLIFYACNVVTEPLLCFINGKLEY